MLAACYPPVNEDGNEISPCSRGNAPLNGPFSIAILVYRRVVYSFLLLNKVHKHDYLLNPTWPYCVAEVWLLKAEIKVLIFSCASSYLQLSKIAQEYGIPEGTQPMLS